MRNIINIKNKTINKVIVLSVIISLFWSVMPLIGWSKYTLEDGQTGCSLEWKEKTSNVISYNVCMFIFVFLLPFSLILISNFKSFLIVSINIYYFDIYFYIER